MYNTVVPLICGFAFQGFSYSQSITVQNIQWRIPEIHISCKLCASLRSIMKSAPISLCSPESA